MYKFKINDLNLKTIDGLLNIKPKKVNVIIGPNNSGKSRLLKELRDYLSGDERDIKIIKKVVFDYPANLDELDKSYDLRKKMSKDSYGNWVLRTYLNKPERQLDGNSSVDSYFTRNLYAIGENWKDQFQNLINNKDDIQFLEKLGPLFFQYLGTEEKLIICKTQKNYGLDSNSNNFFSSIKFQNELMNELSNNVKRIFKKDILLDTQTLGDRLAFRVGENFDSYRNKNKEISKLFEEELLDNQGDGLKSYVSTFLSLKLKGSDVLLIDEPEAFLHPPLARQLGELLGEFNDEKQIFISTHSVEILKGILSKNSDVNVIRITQPELHKNKITVLDETLIQKMMETPMLRVSRVLEGLFCEKVVITEAEADELIYQELIDKAFEQTGLYFAHGQNKQTLVDIAEFYQKIGIEYEVITDFDFLRSTDDINAFFKFSSCNEEQKQRFREYITKLRNKVNEELITEGLSKEEKDKRLKDHRNEIYHKRGLAYLTTDLELKNNIEELISTMEESHLHILKTGELETTLQPFGLAYTKNKSAWFVEAINIIAELTPDDIKNQKDLFEFLSKIVGN